MPELTDATDAQKQLIKDLLIDALRRNRTNPGYMTRVQVKNAWWWIELLGGAGTRL